ncbi:MAG: Holliday junction branch migration protein RuvA [Limnochordaceae bacterium]|nr:Holliday junction branch migration protein RuvA [Limnochordaceae bacterium]
MIGRLRGELVLADEERCLVDVGGVGYEVYVPESTRRQLPRPGQPTILWCRQVVREDDIRLYGFASLAERELFDQLLTVSGIGPRVALSVLSTFSPERFRRAIALGEAALLVQIPGVGRRSAERWIVEFRNRFHWTADRIDIIGSTRASPSQSPSPLSQPQTEGPSASPLPRLQSLAAFHNSGKGDGQVATGEDVTETGYVAVDGEPDSEDQQHQPHQQRQQPPHAQPAVSEARAEVPPTAAARLSSLWGETLAALTSLGYSDREATAALDALTRNGEVSEGQFVQEWLRAALRRLSPPR